jgi:hypothetical protein
MCALSYQPLNNTVTNAGGRYREYHVVLLQPADLGIPIWAAFGVQE